MTANQPPPDLAPGCFGSPLSFVGDCRPCNLCPFNSTCGPAADGRSERLRARYDIKGLMNRKPRPRPIQPIPPAPPVVAERPKLHISERFKAALGQRGIETLERWSARGIDLKAAVEGGHNPFTGTTSFMRPMLDALMKGGFTREEARHLLIRELGWSETMATTHVGFGIPILLLTGAATFQAGRVIPFNRKDKAA